MAKTATLLTLSPLALVPSTPIFAEHQRAINEGLNYAAARRPVVYINANLAHRGFHTNESPRGNRVLLEETVNTWQTVLLGTAWIGDDVQSLTCAGNGIFAIGETGEVRFTVGAANVILALTNAAPADSDTLLTSATGSGLVAVTIEARRTAGTLTTNSLINVLIQSGVIAAADLPDPVND